jgi:hypothetical protein
MEIFNFFQNPWPRIIEQEMGTKLTATTIAAAWFAALNMCLVYFMVF